MKQSYNIDDTILDQEIKNAFACEVKTIKMKDSIKNELLMLPDIKKPPTALQALLEKEICIPVITLPALALSLMLLVGVSFNTLLAPDRRQEGNYSVIEVQYNQGIYITDRR